MNNDHIEIAVRSHVHARVILTFVSKPNRDHDREIQKIDGQNQRRWHVPFVPASPSIFRMKFPETGWTRENAPTRPETVPTCPALPTYTQQARQKVCYLTYLALYLKMAKQAHQHAHSTILTRNTRAQGPTLDRTSRDASDTRVWHTTCTL